MLPELLLVPVDMWEAFCHLVFLAADARCLSGFDLLCAVFDREETKVPRISCFCQIWYNKAKDWVGCGQHSRPVHISAQTLQTDLQSVQGLTGTKGKESILLPKSALLSPQPSFPSYRTCIHTRAGWYDKTQKRRQMDYSEDSFPWALLYHGWKIHFLTGCPAKEMCKTHSRSETWKSIALLSWVFMHIKSAPLAVPHGSFEWLCHIWEPHGYPEARFSGLADQGPPWPRWIHW